MISLVVTSYLVCQGISFLNSDLIIRNFFAVRNRLFHQIQVDFLYKKDKVSFSCLVFFISFYFISFYFNFIENHFISILIFGGISLIFNGSIPHIFTLFCFFNILFVFGRFGRFNRIPAFKTCDLTSVKHLCYGVLLRLSFRQPVRPVGTVTKICTLPLTSILCKK